MFATICVKLICSLTARDEPTEKRSRACQLMTVLDQDPPTKDTTSWRSPLSEAQLELLKQHRDAWQELCSKMRRQVVQHEHQLKD